MSYNMYREVISLYYESINCATEVYPFLIEHQNVKYIPHFHEETELVYVIEGNLSITIENNNFTLEKGDICIFTPELIHNLYSYKPSKTFVMKLFPVVDLKNIQLYNNVVRPGNEVYDELLKNINCIMKENKEKLAGYELSVNICAEKIFLTIIRDIKYITLKRNEQVKLESKSDFLNSVTDFLEKHYAEDFSLEQVAKHFKYTKSYFCHHFKRITGVTFWKYYTIFRLEKSIQMMKENPSKKFIEIATNSGFKNIRSFNQSFKEYHHCPPSEYMKKYYSSKSRE